jgi:hypothetical protein
MDMLSITNKGNKRMYNFLFTHQDQIVHVSRLIVGCLAVALPMILLYGFSTITTKENK